MERHRWTSGEIAKLMELRSHIFDWSQVANEMKKEFGSEYFTANVCCSSYARFKRKEEQAKQNNGQANSEISQQNPTPVQQNPSTLKTVDPNFSMNNILRRPTLPPMPWLANRTKPVRDSI